MTAAHIAGLAWAFICITAVLTIFRAVARDWRKASDDIERVRQLGRDLTTQEHFTAWEKSMPRRARGFARGRV